eukprot:3684050-Amphidinium_carterae.1
MFNFISQNMQVTQNSFCGGLPRSQLAETRRQLALVVQARVLPRYGCQLSALAMEESSTTQMRNLNRTK